MMAELLSKFTSSVKTGVAPALISFNNISVGAYTSVKWDFGDGTISTEINPTHTFSKDGSYSVILTVFDVDSNESSSNTTISIFSDKSLTKADKTAQHGLFANKRLSQGQVNVKKQTLQGSIFETEYPLYKSNNMRYKGTDNFGPYQIQIASSSMTGTHTIEYSGAASSSWGQVLMDVYFSGTSEDIGYIGLMLNEHGKTLSSGDRFEMYDGIQKPRQILFYNITGHNATTNTFDLDRASPTYGVVDDSVINAFVFFTKTGSTNQMNKFYTNDNVVSVRSQQGIDSLDALDTTGMTNVSTDMKGSMLYFNQDGESGHSATFVYPWYSGYTASDALYPSSVRYYLPWVMWHKSTTPGITLYDSYGNTQRDELSGLRFRYLRDGTSSSSNIVGRVFYDKKLLVIEDQELNTALQFNSNRSYTLPEPTLSIESETSGGGESGVTYYVTYRVREDGTSANSNSSFGLIGLDPVHCRYVKQITPSQDGAKFRLNADTSNWVTSDPTDGTGFTVGNVDILMTTGSTTIPDKNGWMYSAMTVTYSDLTSGLIVPDYSALTADYTYEGTSLSGNSDLSLGVETITAGYLSGYLETNIYKLAVTCVGRNNEFNQTQNPTFRSGVNTSTYITEVAVYNESNELLMVGKLNKPIEKNDQKFVTIKLELDL
jgi:PKD repeat protein